MDFLNPLFEPWESFTRGPILPPGENASNPEQRLKDLALKWDLDLVRFTSDNQALFVQALPCDLGDTCIWQGLYTAYRVLAWRQNPTAGTQVSMEAAIRGLTKYIVAPENILVRGVAPTRDVGTMYTQDPNWKQYYFTRGDYLYREDASLDSLLGFLFGAAVAIKYASSNASTQALKQTVVAFATKFKANGYKIVHRDGSPTVYGNCSPGFLQAPVRNLTATLVLKLADDKDWLNLEKQFGPEFKTTETHFFSNHGWYNDNLAVLATLAYLLTAKDSDPGFHPAYDGLSLLLEKSHKLGNSFLTFMAALVPITPTVTEQKQADTILLEFRLNGTPNGKAKSKVVNSTRTDIKIVTWGKQKVTTQPLPVWQRPPCDVIWQRSPFTLDGGPDSCEYSGLDFLVAYTARQVFLGRLR